ncbi:Rad52/Rad22 family DNA repair protein [Streptomyces hygroscopicus]|uniref:Rad52/Rad22 family DNA repair protein n=1 Tax=Streptomyces hygroscopicus TaxID=1912 RepID=UPI0036C27CCE
MAHAIEAPASTTAEGPTSHTQNQTLRLSAYQLRMLHGAITPNRVRMLRGMAHLEAWDVRRQLIRIFGFGGYSTETLSLDLTSERETKQGERSRWTVVYRAQVRLTILDTAGREITHWDDAAAGDSVNQPSLGDAHDMAMKTALSQALKRCATNLGDQFGLSLYNNGSKDAVVKYSAAHPPEEWWKQDAPQPPEPDDPPVQPEPQPAATTEDAEPTRAQQPAPQHARRAEAPPKVTLAEFKDKVTRVWNNLDGTRQNLLEAEKAGLADEVVPVGDEGTPTRLRELLENRIAELEAEKRGQRSAA